MRANRTNETALVRKAQTGDPVAIEDLLSAYLPFVYTIVRRAMNEDPDVDDIVQETMLRALRELPNLLQPESFRAWLAAIAVRQVSTGRYRGQRHLRRTADLDTLSEEAEAEPGFEDVTVLNLELAGQRRQLARAREWLDPKDQTVLSLWWLETAGQLTRAELAEALGVSIAHATVRIQRMRVQLDLSRALEAAIEATPRCPQLDALLTSWAGQATSRWRKRLARHTRTCPVCHRSAAGLVAPDALLFAVTLLPVPLALAGGWLAKAAVGPGAAGASATVLPGGKVGLGSHFLHALAAHPVTAVILTSAVITGSATATANWPDDRSTPPVVLTVPTPGPQFPDRTSGPVPTPRATTPPALTPGPVSLESLNRPGLFAATTQTLGVLAAAGAGSSRQIRSQATFEAVPGLADQDCFSFRLRNGQYLRHSSWRLRTFRPDGTTLFRGDATFCPGTGSAPGSLTLESSNYPGWFLCHRGNQLWVDQADGSDQFLADSSFRVRPALLN